MSSKPLSTIVIPAFNAEQYVGRTLESAQRQTYSPVEIIVVDDGSTDSTRLVADKYASGDPRIKVISVANGGVASARNIGIEAGSGEFISFLDADDLWHPTKIERQVAAMSGPGNQDNAACYTLMRIIDVEDRVIRNGSAVGFSGYIFSRHMFARPVGNGSSLLVRKEIALKFGGFDQSWAARGLGGCEDLDFELKIASKHPMQAIRLYLVGYRASPGNMSSNGLALARSVISTVEKHIQSHPELPEWAVRGTRASTLEYALQNIAGVGEWGLFFSELSRLQRLDPGRGMRYAARFSALKLLAMMGRSDENARNKKERPHFYDMDPAAGTERFANPRVHKHHKTIDRLELLDYTREQMIRGESSSTDKPSSDS